MKKIIIFLLFIITLGGYYFFSNYQVFYNPFEIISNEDVAKNEQGICVAENRKLSEAELVTRFLNNKFISAYYATYHLKEYTDPSFKNDDIVKFCPDENSCILRPMPEMTILEYLQKYFLEKNSKQIDFQVQEKQKNDLIFFQSPSLFKIENFKNKKFSFSFYSYVIFNYGTFYPDNCCRIISHKEFLKNKIKEDSYNSEEIENIWKKRGWGSYLLNRQSLFLGDKNLIELREWEISSSVEAIDNCGMNIDDIYQEKLGKTGMGSIIRFGDINNIVKEKKIICDLSIDFLNHWKYDSRKFSFYWDNNKLYSCYQN